MSLTLVRPTAEALASPPAAGAERRVRDREVVAALLVVFGIVVALTWRKWGAPEADAGAELTTADLVSHGVVPYHDIRYYYGPLGLYSLVGAFDLFGASFTTAFAFGLAQTAAIVGVFYALARQWLAPLVAGLAAAVVIAIGFSGTAFNFVLPHTNSATFGLLCLLAALLALARRRLLVAGALAGLVVLTRPEFAAVAAGALVAAVVGDWRADGMRVAVRTARRLALPAIVVPAGIIVPLAAWVGPHWLITEGIVPVHFVKSGLKTQSDWMPASPAALAGLVLRAVLYLGLLGAAVTAAERWVSGRGRTRALALLPLVAAVVGVALVDGALRATGILATQREAIEQESRHLILGMSWLPALGLGAAAWALVRLRRGGAPPLGRAWAADLALIVAAAGLGLRAYNAFTAEGSYAPYYAAPLVLLLAILHQRIGQRRPEARAVSLAGLGVVALGLAAFAVHGLYADQTTTVHTPRGSFVTTPGGARAIGGAVAAIDRRTSPGEHILAAPGVGGIYFMADRPPALAQPMLLPGLLEGAAGERDAVHRLHAAHVRVAAIAARDFSSWGTARFGVDFYPRLGAALRRATVGRTVVGTLANPQGGTTPSHGFTILMLRG